GCPAAPVNFAEACIGPFVGPVLELPSMRVLPFSLVGLGLLLVNPALAATRTWPGAAPCDATLQACIEASASGDIVLIASDIAINEDITLSQSLSLLAAPGRIARFAAGRGV